MSKTRTPIERQVIAITGGARGIGFATARSLHEAGAHVAIGDLDGAAAAAAALGTNVLGASLDVTAPDTFREFLALAERELGPIDTLINNAGIMPIGPLLEESDALARRVFEINVLGVIHGMKLALPAMVARGHGQIVNVSSIAGKSPVPGGASYAASKAAIISLTETARVEFAGSGVAFTCVMPSFTATELIAGTKGTKLIPNVDPGKVAGAIVHAIARPRADVYVPAAVGVIARTQPFIGRRLRDRVNHMVGADRTFLEVDHAARAAYDARIAPPNQTPIRK